MARLLNVIDMAGHLPALWQSLGPGWLLRRAWYAAQKRGGSLRRRLPAAPWPTLPEVLGPTACANAADYLVYRRRSAPAFFFEIGARETYRPLFVQWDGDACLPVAAADELAAGWMRYFGHANVEVGFPPRWRYNPLSEVEAPVDRHWTDIGDFEHGDIKAIWEMSRFGFTYALVRAYWRTGNEQYPQTFWRLVEDWMAQNPPQQGPNWKCGQETSIRAMAWTFGLYGFLDSAATTPARVAAMATAMALFAQRIMANLPYALNQQNNHGISEGMGLWTIGAMFPELRQAGEWQRKGRQILEAEAQRLIYDDGAFSQHSLNYHRLMLHDYLWCLRLGDILQQPFSTALRQRVARAISFISSLQLGAEGQVPRYGQNDGSLLLPLNNCPEDDYRPLIQAGHFLVTGQRQRPPGPWDEDLLWLFGPQALQAPLDTAAGSLAGDLLAEESGHYTMRLSRSSAFVRCGRFRHRPGQADLLHLDLWWQGQNMALDPGTYSYNAPPPWSNPFAATRYHNTVTVDGQEQMDRASRFLWLPWICGHVRAIRRSDGGSLVYWEGQHDGYRRLPWPVTYRRAILGLARDHWLVLDVLHSQGVHDYRLHWLFPDLPYQWQEEGAALLLEASAGGYRAVVGAIDARPQISLLRADPQSPRGWYAPHYYRRQPALSLAAHLQGAQAAFWSLLGPDTAKVTANNADISVAAPQWQAMIHLAGHSETTVVDRVAFQADMDDILELSP